MALKKSQLYSSLWQSCDELRGGMDASQYKDYVLTLLFMKYVSDRYAGQPDALIEVPDGGGFADMAKLKGDKEIGDKINTIISRLAEAIDLKGVIDHADFNDESKLGAGKEMQDRLSKLVAIFEGLDLSANRAEGDDLLGDANEYLMRHFATESGKSKGQFYTPAEVSRVMAKVIGIGPNARSDRTIYDPTCGSGSLLLKVADEAPRGITIYGQEMDNATWALARMNMFLHGYPTAELWRGNTLADPYFRNRNGGLRTFDFAVANPPFSAKAWSNGLDPDHDEFRRFEYGTPPAKNGDYAFLLHLLTAEQAGIEALQVAREAAARELDEFVEEHSSAAGGEEGLLADATNDRGKVTRGGVTARLRAMRDEDAPGGNEERDVLEHCLTLIEAESRAGSAVKEAQADLDRKVLARYDTLTEPQIKRLVVKDKWFAAVRIAIEGEVQRLTQQLAGRVKALDERYARPLPELERDVDEFSEKVEGHLRQMGLSL